MSGGGGGAAGHQGPALQEGLRGAHLLGLCTCDAGSGGRGTEALADVVVLVPSQPGLGHRWFCTQAGCTPHIQPLLVHPCLQGKPAPDVYVEALRRVGCQAPSRALVVEDAVNGLKVWGVEGLHCSLANLGMSAPLFTM
jgi:hypothetical protein